MKKLLFLALISLLLFTGCQFSIPPGSLKKAKPDLIITHIYINGPVYYSIQNKGAVDAGPSTSRLIVNGITVAYDSVDPIEKGATHGGSFYWSGTCVAGGVEDTIQVVADIYYTVDEANEGNNSYTTHGSCEP
jgi:subtilase family serine protease